MKRKFLPVNTPSETFIAKKRVVSIISFDQLKQINGISLSSNSMNSLNQSQAKNRHSLCFTNQKKRNDCLSPFNQSFSSNRGSNVKDNYFPSLNTDKVNFRCAFSNVSKTTNNDIIGKKITKELKNKRNTFNCSAFPLLTNTKDKENPEQQLCTPRFCTQKLFNYQY